MSHPDKGVVISRLISSLRISIALTGTATMITEAVLVSLKVNGSDKTIETSGILFNRNLVLITGTSFLPCLEQQKWISSFVQSSTFKLQKNEYIEKVLFCVFVEQRKTSGGEEVSKEFHSLESEAIGVWKCPLVTESLKKLFHDWTLGQENFEHESEVLSSDDIDLSKELMSIFILLKCKRRGEVEQTKSDDDIRMLLNLTLSLQKPNRGQEVEVVSTPFGNEHFMNSLSRGVVSNVFGSENCIILSDARTVSGCEGGPIFVIQRSRKGKEIRGLLGIVTCPLTWCRGEWVGFTLGISLMPILRELSKTENDFGDESKESLNHNSDLSPLNFIDETVVLVRSKMSWGSGIILNAASGVIVTCSHVVKDDKKVNVFQGENQYPADIVFKSRDDIAYDLAIIKTENNFSFENEAIFSKNPAQVGERVFAVGFPFFSERDDVHIHPSVASGYVSRANPHMIQTTCCIQSGFSGGGLFRDGELLGIIISNLKNSMSALFPRINFIVPSSVFAEPILKYIKTKDIRNLESLESSSAKVQALWGLKTSKL